MYSEIINQLKNIQRTLDSESKDEWMSLKDVCLYSKLSPSTIHRVIQKGQLKVSKKTGKLLFKMSDVENWLNG